MKHIPAMRRVPIGTLSILTASALSIAGCPGPSGINFPPTITGAAVNGTLVQGQAAAVIVSATAVDTDGTVAAVTANLAAIGGQQAQPLTLGQNNIWTFTGTVTPPASGQQPVVFTATDSLGATSQTTVTVTVAGPTGGTTPPVITNAVVTGTLTINQTSSVTVAATVVPVNGTVAAVAADLSPIGGFPATPLVQTAGNIWSFTGLVTPPTTGTQIVTIAATDSLGNVSTAQVTIVVNSSTIASPI